MHPLHRMGSTTRTFRKEGPRRFFPRSLCSTRGDWDDINPLHFIFTNSHDRSSEGDSQRHPQVFAIALFMTRRVRGRNGLQVCNITKPDSNLHTLGMIVPCRDIMHLSDHDCPRHMFFPLSDDLVKFDMSQQIQNNLLANGIDYNLCCKTSKRQKERLTSNVALPRCELS